MTQNRSAPLYPGIYLGMTASCVSVIGSGMGERIMAVPQAFPQYVQRRAIDRGEILPSYVYFESGCPEPFVGAYAKYDGMRVQAHRVAHSFQLEMGDPDWTFRLEEDGKPYTATQLSHYVLKTLMDGLNQVRQTECRRAIVTVPASFQPDARAATQEAAQMAGIDLVGLVDEPKAALFAYINQLQLDGTFESSELFNNKTLLIYDLGGGTLDLSIHQVKRNPNSPLGVEIEDIEISRFTELGGDNFDRLVADYLLNQYLDAHPNLCETEDERDELLVILTEHAEKLKLNLSNAIRQSGQETEMDRSINPGVYKDIALGRLSISKEVYEEIVSPLLGRELGLKDVNLPDAEKDYATQNNLVAPLLDILNKYREKSHSEALPDAVLLYGGMSEAWFVQQRIYDFFQPHEVEFHSISEHPARLCSVGASLLHYELDRRIQKLLQCTSFFAFEKRYE
jgi:molecular chaperone DnaK (HSP70)